MIDTKEMLLFVSEDFFFSDFNRNKVSPSPLIATKIIEIDVKLNSLNTIARNGTLRLAIKNAIPPIRPLFSTIVLSAKKPKNEGTLKPNEAPKIIEIIKIRGNVKLLIRTGNNEAIIPKRIHEARNFCLLPLFDKNAPSMLDPMIVP